MFKKITFFCLSLFLILQASISQDIVTAGEFFSQVSEVYAAIKDYSSNMSITLGKTKMLARVIYLAPNKVRIDFSDPKDQVIVFDGETLTTYLPRRTAVLSQTTNSASLATSEGLSLMRQYYSVSYETSQEPVPLDDNANDEQVVRLMLWRRTTSEAFRYIRLSINPSTKMIRRIEAVTPTNVMYKMDFWGYEANQGITAQQFDYDAPSATRKYNNFIFHE